MSLLVDTSVWSLAFRRDASPDCAEVNALRGALEQGESVVCTGPILQELLQGFAGARRATRRGLDSARDPRATGARGAVVGYFTASDVPASAVVKDVES